MYRYSDIVDRDVGFTVAQDTQGNNKFVIDTIDSFCSPAMRANLRVGDWVLKLQILDKQNS
ncbi:hypothetical protein PC116_g23778 [Phytophthora cactorum]|nr:hypothetical protein PC114_g22355 [Phytophthora cactorum]KAG3000659.1 hypothetical protein PC120_g20656 [Phytophthora cactorum]KAG4227854.1 hypothetical protein PC116_g23778 [Phytophthora cactorum]